MKNCGVKSELISSITKYADDYDEKANLIQMTSYL